MYFALNRPKLVSPDLVIDPKPGPIGGLPSVWGFFSSRLGCRRDFRQLIPMARFRQPPGLVEPRFQRAIEAKNSNQPLPGIVCSQLFSKPVIVKHDRDIQDSKRRGRDNEHVDRHSCQSDG